MSEEQNSFDSWAIIELFGHTQIAGRVTEQTIGSAPMIRVDVPESNGRPAFTKYYGNGAIYSMTPCSEEVARHAVEAIRPAPVNVYMPKVKLLAEREEDLFPREDDDQ